MTKKEKMNLMGRTSPALSQNPENSDIGESNVIGDSIKEEDSEDQYNNAEGSLGFESSREEIEISNEGFSGSSKEGYSGSSKVRLCMKKSRSMQALILTRNVAVKPVASINNRLSADSAFGYRLAFVIDSVCLVSFTFIFWVATYALLLVHRKH